MIDQKLIDFILLSEYKNILININEYADLLQNNISMQLLDVVSERDILMRGLYGNINDVSLWCGPRVAPQHIKVFPANKIPLSNKDKEWSHDIPIHVLHINGIIDKYLKLKAFA